MSRKKQTSKTHIFRALSLIKAFSNVHESAIINKIVSGKEKHSSPLLTVYRKKLLLAKYSVFVVEAVPTD